MGLLNALRNRVGRVGRLMFAPLLPLDMPRSEDELDEAIRIFESQLADPYFRKRPKHHATAALQLAIAYYQKASFYTENNETDLNLAIQFAHQAESYFSKENSLLSWRRLQEILAFAYLVKRDGPRPEHYALAATYLENLVKLAEDEEDLESQILFGRMSLIASAASMFGSPNEKLDKVKAALDQLSKLQAKTSAPPELDSLQLEFMARCFATMRGVGRVDETIIDKVNAILKHIYGDKPIPANDTDVLYGPIIGLQIFSQTTLKVDSVLDQAADRISEKDRYELFEAFKKQDYSRLKEVMSVAEIELALTSSDEAIAEISQLQTNAKLSDTDPDMLGFLIALLYVQRAPFESQPLAQTKSWALARQHFERSWALFQKGSARPFDVFMNSRLFGTLLYFHFGMWSEANELFAAAVAVMERDYKSSAGMLGKQSTLLGVSENKLFLLHNQAYTLARLERTREAVVLLEKWRGRQLNERLRRNDAQLADVKPQDLVEYQETLTKIFDLESKQRELEGHSYVESVQELRAAEALLETIVKRIRGYVTGFLAEPTFDDVLRATTEHCPLAYLLTTEVGGLILLVTHQGEVRSLWLDRFGAHDVQDIMDKLIAALNLSDAAEPVQPAMKTVLPEIMKELSDRLSPELVQGLAGTKATAVCLIPCGSLALLPIHAAILNKAPSMQDSAINEDDSQPCFEISYAPSAAVLYKSLRKVELKHESTPSYFNLVGVGDPTHDLQYAGLELNAICALFNRPHSALLLRGSFAVKEILTNGLAAATHIHFACHGEFKDPSEPLDAALKLAGGQTLTLREIFDEAQFQHLNKTRIVTLSACKSALVDFRELPEEVMGLPAGFLAAGVPGVIGTLWSVDDCSTALLMTRFYQHLITERLSPACSLAMAQRWLRDAAWKEIDCYWPELAKLSKTRDAEMAHPSLNSRNAGMPPFSNPYYWAGFVFVGA